MMKVVRITGLMAAISVAVLWVLPVVLGADIIAEDLESAAGFESAVAKFKKTRGNETKARESRVSPLLREAELFALYLNPPKPERSPRTRSSAGPGARSGVPAEPTVHNAPPRISVKFTLIGTSYFASCPELSLALIEEVGKGELSWVRQSSKVGHLVIEEIGDGMIVVSDGKTKTELTAKRPPAVNLLKGAGSVKQSSVKTSDTISISMPVSSGESAQDASDKVVTAAAGKGPEQTSVKSAAGGPPVSEEVRQAAIARMLENLKAFQTESGIPGLDGEIMELGIKPPQELEKMRISREEAEDLDRLGQELRERAGEEPNAIENRRLERLRELRERKRRIASP